MLPVVVRAGGALVTSSAARAAVAPAITTVTGVARDVTRRVAMRQLAKGVTIGSLATMGIDAVMDVFLDDPDTVARNAKSIVKDHGADLSEDQVDAIIELSNQMTLIKTGGALSNAELNHNDAIDSSDHVVYGMPNNPLFELPTDGDADRQRAAQLYEAIRGVFNFEQVEALMMLATIAQSEQKDEYLDFLEGNLRVSRA